MPSTLSLYDTTIMIGKKYCQFLFLTGINILHHVFSVSSAASVEDNVIESNALGHVVM